MEPDKTTSIPVRQPMATGAASPAVAPSENVIVPGPGVSELDTLEPQVVQPGSGMDVLPSSAVNVGSLLDTPGPDNVVPVTTAPTPVIPDQPKRRNRLALLGIFAGTALLVALLALFLFRNRAPGVSQTTQGTPDQTVQISDKPASSNLSVLGVGTTNQLLVNADVVTSGSLYLKQGSFYGQLAPANLTANQKYTLPNASGTLCLDSNNCSFALSSDVITTSLGGVSGALSLGNGISIQGTTLVNSQTQTTINNLSGALTVTGTTDQINVSTSGSTITLSTPQGIAPTNSPTFAGITVTGASLSLNGVGYSLPSIQGTGVLVNNGVGGLTWSAIAAACPTCFVNSGNSFGADATLGTNDNFALNIETNGTTRMKIGTNGHIGLGNANGAAVDDCTVLGLGTCNNTVSIQEIATGFATNYTYGIDHTLFLDPTGDANNTVAGINNTVLTNPATSSNYFIVRGETTTVAHAGTGAVSFMEGEHVSALNASSGDVVFLKGLQFDAGNIGSGNVGSATGVSGNAVNAGSGDIGTAYGFSATAMNLGSGDITTAYGINVQTGASSTGAVINNYGINIESPDIAGAITNNYGLYIQDQSVAGSNDSYNLFSGGSGTNYFGGLIIADTLGGADNNVFLCRNSVNEIAACDGTLTGAAFVQGGNSFGATATLGTNDNNSLAFETSNTVRMNIGTNGHIGIGNYANAAIDDCTLHTYISSLTCSAAVNIQEDFTDFSNNYTTGQNVSVRAAPGTSASSIISAQNISTELSGAGSIGNVAGTFSAVSVKDSAEGSAINQLLVTEYAGGPGLGGQTSGISNSVDIASGGLYIASSIVNDIQVESGAVVGDVFGGAYTMTLAGQIGEASGLFTSTQVASTGVLDVLYGLNIGDSAINGGAGVTDLYGIKVGVQTGATNSYGIRVDTAATQTLWVGADVDGTTANGGIAFGASRDTNLYRSAANVLKTDDNLDVRGDLEIGSANTSGFSDCSTVLGSISCNTSIDSTEVYTNPTVASYGTYNVVGIDASSGVNAGNNAGTSHLIGLLGSQNFTGINYGTVAQALYGGSGTVSDLRGVSGSTYNAGGTITMASGLYGRIEGVGGTVGTGYGLQVASASGGITNNYGIYVQAQTVGTSDYGARIDAADTQTLWLSGNADNTTASAGIAFGASRDTNLYRSAANTLKTDDALEVVSTLDVTGHSALGGNATVNFVNGSAYARCVTGTCSTISNEATRAVISLEETITDTTATSDQISVGQQNVLTVTPTAGLGGGSVIGQLNSVALTNGQFSGYLFGGQSVARTASTSTPAGVTGQAGDVQLNHTGGITTAYGIEGSVTNLNSGSTTTANGGDFSVINNGGGSITVASGIYTRGWLLGNGGFTNYNGLKVESLFDSGAGSVTVNYGINISPQSAGLTDYGIAVGTADTQTLWLSSDANNTSANAGIAFGSSRDTNLYRLAVDTLRTDDMFSLGTLGTTDTATYLCRNSSNIIAACSGTSSGSAFVQGGNSFGADATLGTNDSNDLVLRTNGTTRVVFDDAGYKAWYGGISSATPQDFTFQGTASSTIGTAGSSLIIKGGSGASSGAGSVGGGVQLIGANAGGSGDNDGGAVTLSGGTATGNGSGGAINLTGGNGVGISAGGAVNITGGTGFAGGNVNINGGTPGGASAGAINIGTTTGETITVGSILSTVTLSAQASSAINIGTAASPTNIAIGNATGAASLTLASGSGDVNIQSQDDINIGTNAVAQDITIGNTTAGTTLTLNTGTGVIGIGTTAQARSVNIATGAAVQTVALGSTNTTSFTTIQGGATAGGGIGFNVGGTSQGVFTSNTLFLGNASAIGVNGSPSNFTVRGTGSFAAGTTGGALSLVGGGGYTIGTGSDGGAITLQGGAGGGSNARSGGLVTIQGGTASATGTGGGVTIVTGAGGATSGNSGGLSIGTGSVTSGTAGSITFQTGGTTACTISGSDQSLNCPGAGGSSLRFGSGAAAAGVSGTALGIASSAGGTIGSTAVGYAANASGQTATALGFSSAASATDGLALGYAANAGHTGAIAIGSGATSTAANQLVVGSNTQSITSGYFGNGVTNAAPVAFTLNATGSSTAGTAGAAITVQGGAGATSTTGSSGGGLTLQGGNAGGSGDNNGGNVVINGGTKTGSGTNGTISIGTTTAGSITIGHSLTAVDINTNGGTFTSSGPLTLTAGNLNLNTAGGGNTAIGNSSGTNTITGVSNLSANTGSGYVATFDNDGNNQNRYGIKVTAGADDGSGTTYYLDAYDGNGDQVGYIANTAGTFALTDVSDARTKTNIQDTNTDADAILDALHVVDFNRLQNPDGPLITGFIAQEVQNVYGQAVTTSASGLLGVSKDAFIPILVKGHQNQEAKLVGIDSRLASLEQQMTTLMEQQGAVSAQTSVNTSGPSTIEGLTVTGVATIAQLTVTGDATFAGNITVQGHIVGNSDTRGTVTVPAGQTEVKHTFKKPYGAEPNIILTPKNGFAPSYRVEATETEFKVFFQTPAATDLIMNYQVQQ